MNAVSTDELLSRSQEANRHVQGIQQRINALYAQRDLIDQELGRLRQMEAGVAQVAARAMYDLMQHRAEESGIS
jgi:hypothetical protein